MDEKLREEFLRETILKWIGHARKELIKRVKKKEKHLPEGLADDIWFDLSVGVVTKITLSLGSKGDAARMIDIKKLKWEKVPHKAISLWVTKHYSRLRKRKVPGYKNQPKKLTKEKQIERIAAAIAFRKRSRPAHSSKGRWLYAKRIYQLISVLEDMLRREQHDWLKKKLKNEFENLPTVEFF